MDQVCSSVSAATAVLAEPLYIQLVGRGKALGLSPVLGYRLALAIDEAAKNEQQAYYVEERLVGRCSWKVGTSAKS